MPFADSVIRSLHDPALYREAAGRSLPRSLLHLVRLAFLAALALTAAATLWLSSLWTEHVAPVLDSLPTITIRDGVATVEGPQPWVRRVVRDRDGHDWVIILDTTGRTEDLGAGERGLLLQRTELKVKSSDKRVDSLPLAQMKDIRLGPHALRRALLWRLMLVPPALLSVTVLWFFLMKALQALLLARWVRRARARRRADPLPLRARLNVAAHALTAPVLLDCVLWWLPMPALVGWTAYVVLALLYTAAGERQIKLPPA